MWVAWVGTDLGLWLFTDRLIAPGSRYNDEGVGDSIAPGATGVEGNCVEGSWN